MLFSDIKPFVNDQSLPTFAKIPKGLQGFLGINNKGEQNAWGKALNWVPGLNIAAAIGDKVEANRNKGTDAYNNLNQDAKNAGIGWGAEALTALDITADVFTGNFGGIGKDVMGLGKAIAGTSGDKKLPVKDLISGVGSLGFLNNLFKKKKTDDTQQGIPQTPQAFNTGTDPNQQEDNPNAPTQTDDMTPIDVQGGSMFSMFRNGGKLIGPTHEDGGIGLIDMKTGKDTGMRVEGDERIVPEEDWVKLLGHAKKGEANKIAAILKDIDKRKPVNKEFAGGGPISASALSSLSDSELAALARETGLGGKAKQDEETAINDEVKRRGYRMEYVDKFIHDKQGKQIPIDKNFDYFKWHNSVQKQTPSVKEGVVNTGSNVLADNYSNSKDAVYKNGKWFHTQGDNKGQEVDSKLQKQLTEEYIAKQPPVFQNKPNEKPAQSTQLPATISQSPLTIQGTEISQTPQFVAPAVSVAPKTTATRPKTTAAVTDPSQNGGLLGSDIFGLQNNTTLPVLPEIKSKIGPLATDEDRADSTTQPTATPTTTSPNTKDLVGNITGSAFDAVRLGMGLSAATKKLPDYKIPAEWADYMNKARYFSNTGISPEEKALVTSGEQGNYSQAVRDITNASGGNAGMVAANLARVNAGRGETNLALATKDAALKEMNFYNFLPVVNQDIAMNKEIFDRKYNEALATKQSGSQLASNALSDINNRMEVAKAFGPGSQYDTFNKALIAKGQSEADIATAQAKYFKEHPEALLGFGYTAPKAKFDPQTGQPIPQ